MSGWRCDWLQFAKRACDRLQGFRLHRRASSVVVSLNSIGGYRGENDTSDTNYCTIVHWVFAPESRRLSTTGQQISFTAFSLSFASALALNRIFVVALHRRCPVQVHESLSQSAVVVLSHHSRSPAIPCPTLHSSGRDRLWQMWLQIASDYKNSIFTNGIGFLSYFPYSSILSQWSLSILVNLNLYIII